MTSIHGKKIVIESEQAVIDLVRVVEHAKELTQSSSVILQIHLPGPDRTVTLVDLEPSISPTSPNLSNLSVFLACAVAGNSSSASSNLVRLLAPFLSPNTHVRFLVCIPDAQGREEEVRLDEERRRAGRRAFQ